VTPSQAPVSPGDLLAGKFRVERVLGAGGMGVVVVARHTQLDQRVAIKFLLQEVLSNPEAVGRFAREAKAAAVIKSEHVARVIDVSTLENGAPYIVMEYLEGKDLSALLEEHGPLPPWDAVDYVLQALEALCEAHLAGIIHRDLKPANMFLTHRADGSPLIKILDFGISKINAPGEQAMTQTASMLGSPLYMAPEQMRASKAVDQRADIWSMGVILYQLMTGDTPFMSESLPMLVSSVMYEPAPPPSRRRQGIPPGLDAVVLRCIEKEPEKRFQNVGELAVALVPYATDGTSPAPAGAWSRPGDSARISVERIQRMMAASGVGLFVSGTRAVATSTGSAPGVAASPFGSSGSAAQAWQATQRGTKDRSPRWALALFVGSVLVGGGSAWMWGLRGSHGANGAQTVPPAASSSAAPPPASMTAAVEPPPASASASAAASSSAPPHPAAIATRSRPAATATPTHSAVSPPPPDPGSEFGGRH
jgi:serine/threonine-protein kinase